MVAFGVLADMDTGMPTLQQARETFYTASGSDWLKPYTSWADFARAIVSPSTPEGMTVGLTATLPA